MYREGGLVGLCLNGNGARGGLPGPSPSAVNIMSMMRLSSGVPLRRSSFVSKTEVPVSGFSGYQTSMRHFGRGGGGAGGVHLKVRWSSAQSKGLPDGPLSSRPFQTPQPVPGHG